MAQAAPCIPHAKAKWRWPARGSPPPLRNAHDAHDDANAGVSFEPDALDDIHSYSRANHGESILRTRCSHEPCSYARQAAHQAQIRSREPLSHAQLHVRTARRGLHHASARSAGMISHSHHRNIELRCERVRVHAAPKNRTGSHIQQTRLKYAWTHNLTLIDTQAESRTGYRVEFSP